MEYAHPEVLVDTQWVADNFKDSGKVRIAEVDYDPRSNYSLGHIPGSVLFDWKKDINDPVARNVLSKQACEELLQRAGLSNDTTLILYGDFNNWFAAFAFWVFKYYAPSAPQSTGAVNQAANNNNSMQGPPHRFDSFAWLAIGLAAAVIFGSAFYYRRSKQELRKTVEMLKVD